MPAVSGHLTLFSQSCQSLKIILVHDKSFEVCFIE